MATKLTFLYGGSRDGQSNVKVISCKLVCWQHEHERSCFQDSVGETCKGGRRVWILKKEEASKKLRQTVEAIAYLPVHTRGMNLSTQTKQLLLFGSQDSEIDAPLVIVDMLVKLDSRYGFFDLAHQIQSLFLVD